MKSPYRCEPRLVPWLFLAPFFATSVVFLLWPLGQSVVLSFQQTFGPRATQWVGLDNFRFLFGDPLFWKAVRNTLLFTAGSMFIQLPLSLGLAMLLNRPGLRGRAFYRLVFFAPSLVGLVFVGMMFALFFEKRTGLINVGLNSLFSAWNPDFAWLDVAVMPALILAALWLYVGFNMVYFLSALQKVPAELREAADLDGGGSWDRPSRARTAKHPTCVKHKYGFGTWPTSNNGATP